MAAPGRAPARERILDTAYELFSHNGIRAVGIDRIVAESGVAKMSLYHHFPSKDDLVLAFLELRMERWTRGWLEAEIERRAETPRERLLAVFDVFDEWFHESDFEGCSFILTLMEGGPKRSRIDRACIRHLDAIKTLFVDLARQAGATDPDNVGLQVQVLAMGAIVSAGRGDVEAARRARPLAEHVLDATPGSGH
jgi:AcrR family transcriptional regulator